MWKEYCSRRRKITQSISNMIVSIGSPLLVLQQPGITQGSAPSRHSIIIHPSSSPNAKHCPFGVTAIMIAIAMVTATSRSFPVSDAFLDFFRPWHLIQTPAPR